MVQNDGNGGADGADGAQGIQGVQGIQGATGAPGSFDSLSTWEAVNKNLSTYNQVLAYDVGGNLTTVTVSSPAITKTYNYVNSILQTIVFSGAGVAGLTQKTKTLTWTGDALTGIAYST
jgi:hypothetical protein